MLAGIRIIAIIRQIKMDSAIALSSSMALFLSAQKEPAQKEQAREDTFIADAKRFIIFSAPSFQIWADYSTAFSRCQAGAININIIFDRAARRPAGLAPYRPVAIIEEL